MSVALDSPLKIRSEENKEMPLKHQGACFRNIGGVKYENYCDLIMGEKENEEAIETAKKNYRLVKKIKHWTGEYYQLFVAN